MRSPRARLEGAVALALALAAAPAGAASPWWAFQPRPYFEPVLADPRAAALKIAFPSRIRAVPYAVDDGAGWAWDITMGAEVPLVGYQRSTLQEEWVERGRWGAGVWLPVGFHMIEDLGKDPSNPILNVDYRFGLAAKLQIGLPWTPAPFGASVLGLQVVVGHESTHVGDEFTLNALAAHGDAFRRVNVSYQFVEPGVELGARWTSVRARVQARCLFVAFTGSDSWYSERLEQPVGGTVTPSRRNFEPALAVEALTEWWTWRPFASIDLRPRTVYDYDRPSREDGEDLAWSVNALAGLRPPAGTGGGLTHVYVRGYHGVNPAGQFREQRGWWLVGLGLAFFHGAR